MDNYGYQNQNDNFFGGWNEFTLDDEHRAKSRFSRMFLALFAFTVVSNVVAIIIEIAITLIFDKETANSIFNSYWYLWVMNVLSMYVIAFPTYYLILKKMRRVERVKSSITVSKFFELFFISQAFTYVGNIVGNIFNSIATVIVGEMPEDLVGDMVLNSPLWLVLLVTVIIGPIVEELMFRKLLIDRMSIYGDKLAIIVSAVAFGLFHGNFYQLFYAALIGFVLGYIYVKTANILYPIAMHILFNLWGTLIPWLLADKYDRFYEIIELMNANDTSALDTSEIFSVLLPIYGYTLIQFVFAAIGLFFFIKHYKNTFISDRCEVLIPKARRSAVIVGNVGGILFIIATAFTMLLNIISPLLTAAA